MASNIIGVMGKKQHGKDTIASHLVESHAFTRFAFADPMREVLLALDPIIPFPSAPGATLPPLRLAGFVQSVGWEVAKRIPEVRRLLQEYGTGLRLATYADVWVDTTLNLVDTVSGPVVISDVRFLNEVEAIREKGGILVYVINARVPATDPHPSENAVDRRAADYVIHNDGTIAELAAKVDQLFRK